MRVIVKVKCLCVCICIDKEITLSQGGDDGGCL